MEGSLAGTYVMAGIHGWQFLAGTVIRNEPKAHRFYRPSQATARVR